MTTANEAFDLLTEGARVGRMNERDAIVAWLRSEAKATLRNSDDHYNIERTTLSDAADAIEAEQHHGKRVIKCPPCGERS